MKELFSVLSVGIGIVGYSTYFTGILKRETQPHLFSWIIWGILSGTAFFVQVSEGAGAGSALTGATALICFSIAGFSLKYADKSIKRIDCVFLVLAIVAILLWRVVEAPAVSIVLLATIDALGFLPSIRKAFRKPFAENPHTFALQSSAFACSIIALDAVTFETAFFPIILGIVNGSFSLYVYWRRRVFLNEIFLIAE